MRCISKLLNSIKITAVIASIALMLPVHANATTSIIQDGTFLQPIGTGSNLTPWSDWTSAGVTRVTGAPGVVGDYASIPFGGDLFQRFSAPAPGQYILSFLVQNPMPYVAQMIIDLQQPLGGGWHDFPQVLNLAASSGFIRETFTVNWIRDLGTPSEFYFSNSYDYPDPSRGFQNSVNPQGTFLNVAEVSFLPSAAPEPATWAMMLLGFLAIGHTIRRQKGSKLSTA